MAPPKMFVWFHSPCVICASLTSVIFLYRFFAIVHPLRQMTQNRKITVMTSLIIIWACALSQLVVRNTVPVFSDKRALFNETSEAISIAYSRLEDNKPKYYLIAVFLLYNVIPFVVVFYLYIRIIMKLRSRQENLGQKSSITNQRHKSVIRNKRKTVIMLIIVPVVLLLCGWPFTILHIILVYIPESQSTNIVKLISSLLRILVFIASAANPVIYNFFSEKFRAGFRQTFSK